MLAGVFLFPRMPNLVDINQEILIPCAETEKKRITG